ncbi:uncharacterized protein LOC117512927 isoform X2 [Thalassophryne amazonica]|uniref:uncharacterized protein LOC117512927 isoform X2 n=1 Tax=Thalassophryne amazonica TaxID=390379 RepID=UPI00147197B5|nr:uncharacterized protein LOC117512927 isoform X2 [Thalassophryne amazonica]
MEQNRSQAVNPQHLHREKLPEGNRRTQGPLAAGTCEEQDLRWSAQSPPSDDGLGTSRTLVRVIVVGAGSRGAGYSLFASVHPDRMKVIGVADLNEFARTELQQKYEIVDENVFEDWSSVTEREKFADAVLICTPDHLHKEPAVAFAKKGYHVLLEKPMAMSAEDCREIVAACTERGVMLMVGHVLRYDPLIRKIKELIDAGVIGDLIHIQHLEPVGFFHFAHSYVRGNWRKEAESSFSLLAKSCHDIDLIHHWAGARRCVKVSSFGSLCHFRKESKPPDAAARCLDCSVEADCPYSACKIYLDKVKLGHAGWPVSVICPNSIPDIESVTEALKTGPYGRCVYECDNDVCTNQVVNMEFEGGLTAAFTMMAFTRKLCMRQTTIYGTKNNDPSLICSGPEETLLSHLLVFDAERSRREDRVVHCDRISRS